ncbi:MAG: ATP-dependent RNA helicase HrpA [Desulfotalea sp.]
MSKYLDNLPIDEHKSEIIEAIRANQVVVIAGDTGSGKTTRIPQFCLELTDNDENKIIGCTQPRRLAATSVAARVGEEVGDLSLVSYKIRFHDHTNKNTKIKFMTDGVLLAETKNDRSLSKYSILILDEAHERNLNIDFLLGYLKTLLKKRPDLKLIITSATIDTISFSKHFYNAPIISIEGRTYPVEVRYEPLKEDDEDYLEHCTRTVNKIFQMERPADTLIFLPTEKDIRSCCDELAKNQPNAEILPLFGRLQGSDQAKIFRPCPTGKIAKIVVATNVAETSLTVPGIRYVIDSGLARMTYYNVRSKTTSLPVQKVSRASCDQRKGRCGRVGPGICIRLFSEDDFNNRDEFTLPEIQRANLAEVLLQMSSLNLGDPNKFPFIDPPARNVVRDGYTLLRELGALNENFKLTSRGRIMANLPIDPCISRLLIEALDNNCLKEVKILASALSIQDPRIRPAEKEKQADEAHKIFAHKHSDFMALLNLWHEFHNPNESQSWSRLKRFCKSNFLSFQRMREWIDLHDQLCRIMGKYKQFIDNETEPSYEQIHKSLLAGFLRNIAKRKEKKIYQGAGNRELMIFPGSNLFKTSGEWFVAAGFMETNRLYALSVANIDAEWIEPIAMNLCKYSWTSPRWEKKTGQVIADEKVVLWGLIIVGSRKTNFARAHTKNHKEARKIFIEYGLLTGDITGNFHFLHKNTNLVEKWQKTEERLRKRDIVDNDQALFQFYNERLPDSVFDKTSLIKFLKENNKNDQHLTMLDEDILLRQPEQNEYADFPKYLMTGDIRLKLSYQFDPSGKRDGVSIHIPLELADSINQQQFDWLVPGFLTEKVTFLLKGLPKALRKKLVPVNLAVERLLDDMQNSINKNSSLLGCLESSILKTYRFNISRSDWPKDLPNHLLPHYILEAEKGKEIACGANLRTILSGSNQPKQGDNKGKLKSVDKKTFDRWQGFTNDTWAFQGLPQSFTKYRADGSISGFKFPALRANYIKSQVCVEFFDSKDEAAKINKTGLIFLYRLHLTNAIKPLRKLCANTLSAPSCSFIVKKFPNKREATDALLDYLLSSIINVNSESIPNEEAFSKELDSLKTLGIYKIGNQLCQKLGEVIRKRKECFDLLQKVFNNRKNGCAAKDYEKFKNLIEYILDADFLDHDQIFSPVDQNRYYKSLLIRLERYNSNPDKDYLKEKAIASHLNNITQIKNRESLSPEAKEYVDNYIRLIEEFKIATFSPEIKTNLPISAKKLDKHWQETKSYM